LTRIRRLHLFRPARHYLASRSRAPRQPAARCPPSVPDLLPKPPSMADWNHWPCCSLASLPHLAAASLPATMLHSVALRLALPPRRCAVGEREVRGRVAMRRQPASCCSVAQLRSALEHADTPPRLRPYISALFRPSVPQHLPHLRPTRRRPSRTQVAFLQIPTDPRQG